MWVLVLGRQDVIAADDAAAAELRTLGCRVETADLWDDFDAFTAADEPSVIIVEAGDQADIAQPARVRINGVAAFKSVPTLIALSVKGLEAYELGAGYDDFILRPYLPIELYRRVRQLEMRASDYTTEERIKIGSLDIDLAAHEVHVDQRPVEMTHQEFLLLSFLCQNRGRVYTRDQLLERVWGVDYYGGSRTVDIHVRRLRAKLGSAITALETVRGVGYRMRAHK